MIRYELLDQDPFWVPTTIEELEDLGEKSDRDNVAKKYMDAVRTRKVSLILLSSFFFPAPLFPFRENPGLIVTKNSYSRREWQWIEK
jgi:hypothetical protein